MGGRIRWSKAGAGWPKAIGRTLPARATAVVRNGAMGTTAATWLTQAQVQVLDLQQSGAGCSPLAGLAMSAEPVWAACPSWWHGGMASSASAIAVLADVCISPACPCICAICTDAIAEVAPLNTKATHNIKRNKMARLDMNQLYSTGSLMCELAR